MDVPEDIAGNREAGGLASFHLVLSPSGRCSVLGGRGDRKRRSRGLRIRLRGGFERCLYSHLPCINSSCYNLKGEQMSNPTCPQPLGQSVHPALRPTPVIGRDTGAVGKHHSFGYGPGDAVAGQGQQDVPEDIAGNREAGGLFLALQSLHNVYKNSNRII